MCGIVGIHSLDGARPIIAARARGDEPGHHAPRARTATASTSSRAAWASPCAGSRSSTSRAATSRSRTRTRRVWIVFNGEIYNFRELRARARGARPSLPHPLGHRGRSCTPTRSTATTASSACAACSRFALWDARAPSALLLAARPGRRSSRSTTPWRDGQLLCGLGDQGLLAHPARSRAAAARRRSTTSSTYLYVPGAAHDLRGHPRAPAGPRARRPRAAASRLRARTGSSATDVDPSSAPRREAVAGAPRAARRGGAHAA